MRNALSCFVLVLVACGDDDRAPTDAGGRDSSVGRDAGSSDGGSVDAGPGCPADPPTAASACSTDGQRCLWSRCPGDVSDARCVAGSWMVTTTACGEFDCNEMRCTADEICVQRIGGAFIVSCEANPCGDGAVERACACSVCGSFPCTVDGRTVSCQTCPAGELCP